MSGNTTAGATTRQKILEAAIATFAENGFNGSGIKEITERAGVVRPSLYHYYGSKEGLWKAVHEHLLDDLAAYINQKTQYGSDLAENLGLAADVLIEYSSEYPQRLKILFQAGMTRSTQDLRNVHERFFPTLKAMIESAFSSAGVTPRPELLALYMGFVHNFAINQAMGGELNETIAPIRDIFAFIAEVAKDREPIQGRSLSG